MFINCTGSIVCENQVLGNVKKFSYLGINIESTSKNPENVLKERIVKA
jgi:hypothetical protein